VPWAWFELTKGELAKDGNAVTPIEGNSTDVEDAGNCSVRTKTDQVDSDAPEDRDPNSI
jgi:hypothetical protein